ncbi:hypothetical protein U1Q18_010207 [Sarracenia purpurea var. burkii]
MGDANVPFQAMVGVLDVGSVEFSGVWFELAVIVLCLVSSAASSPLGSPFGLFAVDSPMWSYVSCSRFSDRKKKKRKWLTDRSNRENEPELRRAMDRRAATCDGEEEDGDAKVRASNQSDNGGSEKGACVGEGDVERRKTISSI